MLKRFFARIRKDSKRVAELKNSIHVLAQQREELRKKAQEETMFADHEIARRQEIETTYNELLAVHRALLERYNEMALYFNQQQRVIGVAMHQLKCSHIQNAEIVLEHGNQQYLDSLH
ncbi:MAG: hypothetical protein AAB795_02380 [Patescibacteria group bacterium]